MPHRILYLTFGTFPSTAAHSVNIVKMCEALTKFGYKVTLTADAQKREKDIFEFYNIKFPFDIKRIKLHNIRIFGRIIFLIKAYFFARKKSPDFLYTRDIFSAFLAKTLRLPFVYEVHEVSNTFLRNIILTQILSSRHLKLLVFISIKLKESFVLEMGNLLKDKKCIVAHDGVDLEEFDLKFTQTEARCALNLPEEAFIAGYTGSLFKGRGVEIILKLSSVLKDVIFVIVGGEGDHLAAFKKKVKELKLKNLIVRGFVPYRVIPLYLSAFDILLMPYQTKVLHRQKKHDTAPYMSPLKMFEYMASGKPIISSDIGVLKEVLSDKDNALLVNPEEIDEWIKAVELLRKEKGFAEELGKKAKNDVKQFLWEKRIKIIFENI